jgi:Ca2+-transporting ATPase
MSESWYAKTSLEVLDSLAATEHGLTPADAIRRLKEQGENVLPESPREALALIFVRQFQSPLIYILFGASAVVYFTGEPVDAAIILGVLVFNAIIGTIQEGRAQSTLSALKNFVETKATVTREGKELVIPDRELVAGDIILLQEGERVPADARLIHASTLKVDEAALTGESTPAHKITEPIVAEKLQPVEQKNMVFKGTYAVAGNARAVVVATGQRTVIGGIAQKISTIDTEVPLKKNIRALSRVIIGVVAVLTVTLFIYGLSVGRAPAEMFSTVVALAVSVIPEGLPIVITLVLATGVWRMSKRNALVKKLASVEALGQARVIAVDKTGTITKNELVVERVWVNGVEYSVDGVGYEPVGSVRKEGEEVEPANHPDLLLIGKIAAYCANARVIYSEDEKRYRVSGDPTEAAMLVLSQKLGFHKEVLEQESPLVFELPFDYRHKYHATLHKGSEKILTVVGAPERIIALAHRYREGKKGREMTVEKREELLQVVQILSAQGLRVVGVAESREFSGDTVEPEHLPELNFVGFFGMKDALRKEVAGAMQAAHEAGIRVVMITGDHKDTARAIAKEAGIYNDGDKILVGDELENLSPQELGARLGGVSVFARVTPEHKLRIVEAYRARGEVIAMTGDGVNDAPSLVAADLGVAMGGIGTEVAREASDIVLLDDNFGSIVAAVEEGRNMYRAIQRVVLYLFSTSAGEVLTIVGALALALPLPLLPAQIIWLNFVTDPFLDVALGMEPKDKSLLSGRFKKPKKYIVDLFMVERILLMSLTMAVGALYLFSQYAQDDLTKALTMSLTTLAVFQWFNAWNCRFEHDSIFSRSIFKSPYLLGATGIVVSLQLLAVYHPLLQSVLHTTALSFTDWLVIIPIALSIVLVEETRKLLHAGARSIAGSVHLNFKARSI